MSSTINDTLELARKYDLISDPQFGHGAQLIEELGIRAGSQVLDVGCGTGRLAAHVARIIGPAGRLVGFDPSEPRVALARAKKLDNATFIVGTAANLRSFSRRSFDYAYLNQVIHHIDDKARVLFEVWRVLRKKGKFGLTTRDKENPGGLTEMTSRVLAKYGEDDAREADPANRLVVSSDYIRQLLVEAGFKVESINSRNSPYIFSSPKAVIDFLKVSSSGRFLRHLPSELRTVVEAEIMEELGERYKRGSVKIDANTIFAFAEKEEGKKQLT